MFIEREEIECGKDQNMKVIKEAVRIPGLLVLPLPR